MARVKKKSNKTWGGIFPVKSTFLLITFILLASLGDTVIIIFIKSFFYIRKGLRYARAQTPHMRAYFYQKFLSCRQIAHHIWGNATAIATTIITRGTYQMQNSTLKIRAVISQNQIRLATIPKKLHKKRRPHILLPRARIPHIRLPRFHLHIATPILTFVLGALVVLLFVFVPYNLYLFFKFLPNPHLLSQRFIPVTTQIFDRNGSVLYEIHGDEDRKPIPLPEIPRFVKEATIAIEDKDFYHHPGFSISGIARAAKETFLHKQIQGGSTITQQLIKNSLLTPQISFVRKAREIFLAFWAERLYSKDQILEMYLNQVPYGGTSWGIEAACQRYFGKSVKAVTLAEAAFLAGLPAAPSLYSPYGIRPDLGRIRQHEVLRRMVEDHYITQNEQTAAEEIALNVKSDTTDIKAPHFVMYVRQLLEKKYGERLVDLGGLRITTTLDLQLQEKVQEKVTKNIADLKPLRVGNGAALITNPKNGDILAMAGSKDYFNQADDGNVNVTLAPRQPGSSIKVVTYAAALEHGLTAASTIDDTPIAFSVAGQPTYAPVNYDGRFHGTVTLRSALANSYNVPAVKILNRIGLSTMLEMGNRLGITTWTDSSRFGLSLTLGGGEVTMLDMATVYGTLANQGMRVDLDPILEISDYSGKVYYQKDKPNKKKALSKEIAFILSDILADNNARSLAFGSNSALVIPNKTVSVKTGTTNEKRDNWTIGFTPSFVVTVWVGNNDNSPMDPYLTSGITGAAPIWNQIMSELVKDSADERLTPPSNIATLTCLGHSEYFVAGSEPKNCNPPSPQPSQTDKVKLTETLPANNVSPNPQSKKHGRFFLTQNE